MKTNIPVVLKEPCDDLQELKSGDGKTITLWIMDTIYKYKTCQARHASLIMATDI